jgi:hypothetical protein
MARKNKAIVRLTDREKEKIQRESESWVLLFEF